MSHYTVHPLICEHYSKQLKQCDQTEIKQLYKQIKNYYLALAGDIPGNPTLENLKPLCEVVYYLCQMGAYDQAWSVYWRNISQQKRFVLTAVIGAYETELKILKEFFPDKDVSQQPLVNDPIKKFYILENISFCLMGLGYLNESYACCDKARSIALNERDWEKVSQASQRLTDLNIYLGKIRLSKNTSDGALNFAKRANSKWNKMSSLTYQAHVAYLLGDLKKADFNFSKAEEWQRGIESNGSFLYSWRGIFHANYLRRSGDIAYSRVVAQENLEICEKRHWVNLIGKSHYILGNIDADQEKHDSARNHYNTALKILRGITRKDSLIEALLARGCWAAKQGETESAYRDLEEALDYAVAGNYRIYEIDIRLGLAWAHLNANNFQAAQAEADKAKQMSTKIDYYWGQVDSTEVLTMICNSTKK